MKILRTTLGKPQAAAVIRAHREKHITKADFERIRGCGLNAVRLPFGYWVVLGPSAGEPYAGPGLEYLDRAVDWAEECGLQLVLDLHGCPGGESGEAPCGRRQRPVGTWHWRDWRFAQSLEALKVVTLRYRSRKCITGIAVCNEPSNTVPLARLCHYYDRAVDTVRSAGMPPSHVAVVLPIFQRPEDVVVKKWHSMTGGRHKNVCFDIHCYHCFENEFNGKTFAQQLRAVGENAEMLRKYPMVVGEWSLALGCATWSTCGRLEETDVYRLFGRAQLQAFKEASHGSFFWNWTEGPSVEWNFQYAWERGLLSGPAPQLPRWEGLGEDPLEEKLHPSPSEPRILHGDPVFLRVFHGRYVDVEGCQVSARWPDKGKWQELAFCPAASCSAKFPAAARREVRGGDIVRLRTRSGRFLSVDDGAVSALAARGANGVATEFIVHAEGASPLRHRAVVYLEHRATGLLLDADEEEEAVSARWRDFGQWQQFAIEKLPAPNELVPVTPKKHTHGLLEEEESPVTALLTPRKRKAPHLLLAVSGVQHSTPIRPSSQADLQKKRRLFGKLAAVCSPDKPAKPQRLP